MKRNILLLFFVFIGMNAMAQEFSTDAIGKTPIEIRGSKVFVEDYKLDKYTAAACFSLRRAIASWISYANGEATQSEE